MKPRPLLIALALISTTVLPPTDAAATQPQLDPFERIPAAGTGPGGAEFLGTLDVLRFETRGAGLIAVGALSGRVTRTDGPEAVPVATLDEALVEVSVERMTATCERLHLDFGRVALEPHGPTIAIDPIGVDGTTSPADGAWLEQELCAIADHLPGDAPAQRLTGLLDAVARSFG